MKRLIKSSEDIMCMAKIMERLANTDVTGPIHNYIYFSPVNSGHGPRIKFYGGSKQTSTTQKSPAFGFDKYGPTEVKLQSWMNPQNCPNAFDDEFLNDIKLFISNHLAILQLVWHNHLDEGIALAYFHGQLEFEDLLAEIDYFEEYPQFDQISDEDELNTFCSANNLYNF